MDSSEDPEKLKKLQSEFRENKLAYKRDELFCDLIDECAKDSTVSSELWGKIKRIDLVVKSESYLNLGIQTSVLGLSNLQYIELNDVEKKQIQTLVERKIQILYVNALKKVEPKNDGNLLELHKQMIDQMELYKNNLLKHHTLLEAILTARNKILPDNTARSIEQCNLNVKIVEQKVKMVTEKLRVDIFLEIPPKESLEAYKILIDDIAKQIEQCKTDIEELNVLLQKYELASCKEYDDILETYLRYKTSLNKLKLAFSY